LKSKKGWANAALKGALALAIVAGSVSSIEVQAASKFKSKRGFVVATSEYICTPSGFGRKARCYLKSA
jgi:hypothetical protein